MRALAQCGLLAVFLLATSTPAAAGQFKDLLNKVRQSTHATSAKGSNLPSSDIAAGLKEALAKGTEGFAAERMNRGIRRALSGRRVEDV